MNSLNHELPDAPHPLIQCLTKLGLALSQEHVERLSSFTSLYLHERLAVYLTEQGVPFSATAIQEESDLELLSPPCLVHWNLHHCVVVIDVSVQGLLVWDPYLGERHYRCMEFFDLYEKPGYVNYVLSLGEPHSRPSPLAQVCKREQAQERTLDKHLVSLALMISSVGKRPTRALLRLLTGWWDRCVQPDIFAAPRHNIQRMLACSNEQARHLARDNLAQLAINMGYTAHLLRKLRRPRSVEWAHRVFSAPLSTPQSPFIGQCIIELLHQFDPISAVYSVLQNLPSDRDVVVYGNPWDDTMITVCHQAFADQGHERTLEILPPAGKHSFFKLLKRARAGAHIIMFADGNPLLVSDEASGLQVARSFTACTMWHHRAFVTNTGALLADKTAANLHVAGLVERDRLTLEVTPIPTQHLSREAIVQAKADAMCRLIEISPQGWWFWRNAEVYFHEYHAALECQ
ncbi:ATP-binding protein [Vibrio tapetis]|uniref:Microcin secretion/processing ATP-binding protein n=1 Tax=Vibrio tapetis subsp. tapetis TaxID=1671868 RepID=A0A2N8ZI02_9VIBR|nr:ATP-binding protein [Vibrio tapetis]SON51535.1 Microcin secretion/processing ATP-binding protein [Vibrio tapetis subsp. tapetis]